MSLLSLRKHNLQSETVKRLRHKTRQINAEQFIDQATHYANGQQDNVIAFQSASFNEAPTDKAENSDINHELVHTDKEKAPFRRATFTLSEPCIDSLTEHAKTQQCAKSHLVRMLIRHFDALTPVEQQAILTQQKD